MPDLDIVTRHSSSAQSHSIRTEASQTSNADGGRSQDGVNANTNPDGRAGQGQNRGRGRGRGRGNGRQQNPKSNRPTNGSVAPDSSGPAGSEEANAAPKPKNAGRKGRGQARSKGETASSGAAHSSSEQAEVSVPSGQKPSKGPASSRRKQFGGKLTGNDGESSSTGATRTGQKQKSKGTAAVTSVPAVPEHVDYADLRSRLLAELASGQYDCVVCYSTVTTKQSVWSCSQCHNVLHLNCARKWAESSVKKVEEQNAMQEDPEIRNRRGTWRCPGCQYAREDVPKIYWCWCGRTQEPTGGRGANPHGCGQRCSKGRCSHGCADQCHPGPCPPCGVTVSQQCYCGAKTIPMRCSQTSPKAATLSMVAEKGISCGDVCGRKLDCGIHSCASTCHAGPCEPCSVQQDARCYCGQNRKAMRCGDGHARFSVGEKGDEWQGLYDCGMPCNRPFDCGNHRCQRTCHPQEAQRAKCPSSPELIKTCPCGATSVTNRTSCQDPVPLCGGQCAKAFDCGHSCPSKCHLGLCPPCQVPVSTPCRCGESKQTRPCHVRSREETEGGQEVLCETTCKALRHCGRHQCGRKCCPLSFQVKTKPKKRPTAAELQLLDPAGLHECSIPCGRQLSCGSHNCPMTCHRGACPPCLQASFEELVCNCGRTVMEPPVPCGAQIVCNFPCTRPPPACGHPKVAHNCHEDGDCPPCVYLTEKVCHCQKHIVKNVPCSRTRVSCGQPCDALLNCGFHRCQGLCHDAPKDCAPCDQVCGKPRKLCQHPCQERCHAPSSCPETEACRVVVTLQCACGNLQSRSKCGVSMHNANKEKALKCNDSCVLAQRNARLAEALGLNPTEKLAPARYEEETLLFYANPSNRKFCEDVEATLNDFIRSPRAGMILPPGTKVQRKFTHELAAVYRLVSESLDLEPRRSVSIRRKQDSRIPSPLLSEAFAAAKVSLLNGKLTGAGSSGGPTGLSQLRKDAGPPLNAMLLVGVFGQDEESLTQLLRPALRNILFKLTWRGDEDVLVTSDSSTRLVLAKSEVKAAVARERTAKEVVLCAVDGIGRVVRREEESGRPAGAGSGAGMAWGGATSMSRSATGSGTSTPRTGTGGRGWAAVAAAGSGRSSPTGTGDAWSVGATTSSVASLSLAGADRSARIVPNPNAPQRAPAPSAAAADEAVPESWEDD